MRKIRVLKKTGFKSQDSPIEILDAKREKLFYSHSGNKQGGYFFFNLPKGEYLSNNFLIALREPIPHALPTLPKPEKENFFPRSVKIKIQQNPNKASIWINSDSIKVDPEIFKRTLPEIVFILFHEAGHYLYKDESKCDQYAVREMLKRGYNPSQCYFAIHNALGQYESSLERKKCIHKKLFKK